MEVDAESVKGLITPDEPVLAFVMWGDLFEDFFDTIDVSLGQFETEFTGSWFVGYINAMTVAGARTHLVHVSARVDRTIRFVHRPTGSNVSILPAPRRHRWLRSLYRRSRVRKSLSSIASYNSIPILKLYREVRRAGATAILTQEYEHARFDVLVAMGKITRLPVFATFQGGNSPHSRVERLVRPFTVRASAGLIIASGAEQERVMHAYGMPASRISQTPNAVDTQSLVPIDRITARRTLGLPVNARIVCRVGRVVINRKGLDVLLKAWTMVCAGRDQHAVELVLVGTGEDAREFHQMIAATGLGSIHWRDEFITDKKNLLLYQSAADVYVLPSRHEGFAVAPIEAMALGLPVVAADAPGVRELIPGGEESGGIIVPREDSEALASALGRLIDDRGLSRELGARGQRRATEAYALAVVGSELRAFLFDRRLAAGR